MDDLKICAKREKILNCKGHLLILGGPGSGKTTIALFKAQKHLNSLILKPGQKILFLSFSKSAVRQVSGKLDKFFSKSDKTNIIVQTYHSFCWEILQLHGYFLSERNSVVLIPPHEEAVLKKRFKGQSWPDEQNSLFLKEGRICFDLFAPKVSELLTRSHQIKELYSQQFPLIIVDEFQDSDSSQWNLVKLLSEKSQIICLADQDQQIFSFRLDVSSNRVKDIKTLLNPEIVDFSNENNRSPNNGISHFGNAILKSISEIEIADEIKIVRYKSWQFGLSLKVAVLDAFKFLKNSGITTPPTVAILARTNQLIRTICNELDQVTKAGARNLKPIQYSVLIDEHAVIQAGKNIAYFLEPIGDEINSDVCGSMALVSNFFNCLKGDSNSNKAAKIDQWRESIIAGKPPKTKCVNGIFIIRNHIAKPGFLSGDPIADWLKVRKMFERSESEELTRIAKYAQQLRLLKRGSQINDTLNGLWRTQGNYLGASNALERAISNEHLSQSYMEPSGCTIMNMHKSKGKEFDAVIIVENPYNSSFTLRDSHPFLESRRLLRVAITRSRHQVQILMEQGKSSVLFNKY
jgi:DNA helicase II / ATP-dependent DNA helicase PcrA